MRSPCARPSPAACEGDARRPRLQGQRLRLAVAAPLREQRDRPALAQDLPRAGKGVHVLRDVDAVLVAVDGDRVAHDDEGRDHGMLPERALGQEARAAGDVRRRCSSGSTSEFTWCATSSRGPRAARSRCDLLHPHVAEEDRHRDARRRRAPARSGPAARGASRRRRRPALRGPRLPGRPAGPCPRPRTRAAPPPTMKNTIEGQDRGAAGAGGRDHRREERGPEDARRTSRTRRRSAKNSADLWRGIMVANSDRLRACDAALHRGHQEREHAEVGDGRHVVGGERDAAT